jgi:hypothetical protein
MAGRIAVAAGTILVAASLWTAVPACQFGGAKGAESYKALGLSDQQITQLEAIRGEIKKVRDEDEVKSEELRGKIDQELLKKVPDAKVISALSKQQGALRIKTSQARVDGLLKAKKAIADDQFAKLIGMDFGCRCTEDSTATSAPAAK